MKRLIILAMLTILIVGCSGVQDGTTTQTISGTHELVLTEQDLQQLGMTGDGHACQTEEYQTNAYSQLERYTFCTYNIERLNNTEIVIELKKFADFEDLNGTYQYESLHLRGFQGLLRENEYGELSRFYVNNESAVYYYHLWIVKNHYLIHITSKGTNEAGEYIANIGQRIVAKFG